MDNWNREGSSVRFLGRWILKKKNRRVGDRLRAERTARIVLNG